MNEASEELGSLRFEDALAELEQIVGRLERGQLSLDESLAAYERGIKLIRYCRGLLETAEQKIEILRDVDHSGNPITEPFENDELTLEEKREKRSRRRGAKEHRPMDSQPPETGPD